MTLRTITTVTLWVLFSGAAVAQNADAPAG